METKSSFDNIEDVYPMSDIEKGMVYHSLKNPNKYVYHNQMVFRLQFPEFSSDIFKKAIILLIEKHPILRTGFDISNFDEPLQIVYNTILPSIENYDISHLGKTEQEGFVKQKIAEDKQQPFDIVNSNSLWRMKTFYLNNEDICFLWSCHHVILDGWSSASLMTEINNTYFELKANPAFVPPKLKVTYKEFVIEQMAGKKDNETGEFWKKELEGYKRFEFPAITGENREPVESIEKKTYSVDFGGMYLEELNDAALKYGVTLKDVCFAAYIFMLNMLSYEEDITTGLVTNNRPVCEDGEKVLGCFLNTVPIRVKIHPGINWLDFTRSINDKLKRLVRYNRLSLFEIARLIGEGVTNRNPLFDTLFNFVDFHVYGGLKQSISRENRKHNLERRLSLGIRENTNTLFDFTVDATQESLAIDLSYSNSHIGDEMIERCCGYFRNILDLFIYNPGAAAKKDECISFEEKRMLIYECVDSADGYPGDKTIHRLFTEQTGRTPGNAAVVFSDRHLTYAELDRRSDRLAVVLRENGVLSGSIVGIMIEHSLEMIIGILGILKAGGAYLPIDVEYPQKRIAYMLADSAVHVIVTKTGQDRKIDGSISAGKFIVLDEYREESAGESEMNLLNIVKPVDLSYVIYTSGTTGDPKGAAIEHRNVVQLMFNNRFPFDFDSKDVWTLFHSFCFDFSVWEMYGALLYGGKLILISRAVSKDTEMYLSILKKGKVTVLNQTPAAFYNLSEIEVSNKEKALSLRYAIFGGEALDPYRLRDWKDKYPGTKLINMYGITETTVHVTYKEIKDEDIRKGSSNMGRALSTLRTYLVDRNLDMVPTGVPGELCIAGAGLCRGYLNRAELTGEKFIRNPFKAGEKLYRSGDMALLSTDGELVYAGRIDDQVKIRGYRIELSEIENRLSKYKGIKTAIVLAREDKNKNRYLCAYIVSDVEQDNSELRDYLLDTLPGYMVPSYFVQIESVPVTFNGKIDKKKLPIPGGDSVGEYAAPRNEIERMLTDVWQAVLGAGQVGINDNFFMCGGDSIKMIQIAARMRKLGCRLEVQDLFQYPTISELSSHVKKFVRVPEQSEAIGPVPLTPIQEEFFAKKIVEERHFNQAVMLYSPAGFHEDAVKAVFKKIQSHHDALRMTFKKDKNGKVIQANRGMEHPLSLQVFDYRGKPGTERSIEERCREIQVGIDLGNGPLMKLGLFHVDDGSHLLIVVHHLVIDGVSWRILFEDIETLYRQYADGEELILPLKTDSFKLWAEHLSSYSNSSIFLKEKVYWKSLESWEAPALKKDKEGTNRVKDTRTASFTLDKTDTERLLTKVNRAYNTEINDILLTGLGIAVNESLGCEKLSIALEGHGREDISASLDISRTIGWFTSIFPVILNISFKRNLSRQVKEVKETLRRVPNKGIGYGILKYLTREEYKEDTRFKLSPQVSFNYLGQFDMNAAGRNTFTISKLPTGNWADPEMHRDYLWDVVGIISNGQLSMSIIYSAEQYEEESIISLMDKYKESLSQIISYCSSKKEPGITPSDLTYSTLSIDYLEELQIRYPLEDIYPLSPMQNGMLFHSLLNEDSSSYFGCISFNLKGELDIPVLRASLNELLKRYAVLRSVFIYTNVDIPLQAILRYRDMDFRYEDLRGKKDKDVYIKSFKEKDMQRGFDLAEDVLIRAAVLRLENDRFEFAWSFHHILVDGWSTSILISDFMELYDSAIRQRECRLPEVKPYREFIKWLEGRDKLVSKEYWRKYLEGYNEAAVLKDNAGSKLQESGFELENFTLELSAGKTAELNKLAADKHITLNVLMQTIWGLLLAKYTDKEDVVFGAVVSGRPAEIDGIESIVGLFINTIPLRVRFHEEMAFEELLGIVHTGNMESDPHHYYSLADIQAESVLKQNLFDHVMIFENYPTDQRINDVIEEWGDKKRFQAVNAEIYNRSSYNLSVIVIPAARLIVKFDFNAAAYCKEFAAGIARRSEEIIDRVIGKSDLKIKDIHLSHDFKDNISNQFRELDFQV